MNLTSRSTHVVWAGAIVLALIGVSAAAYRAAYVADAASRAEPVRTRALIALGLGEPHPAERAAKVQYLDSRYAARPGLILVHVLFGAVFLIFAPFQFWASLRNRHRAVHRWSGRVLLLVLLFATAPALYFGLREPLGGGGEALVIGVVAILLLTAAARAYFAIRRGRVARHREWMLRVVALTLGIATVRIAEAGLDLALTPFGVRATTVFVLALWLGWGVTVGIAEVWIILTRARVPAPLRQSGAA